MSNPMAYKVGHSVEETIEITEELVRGFADFSGDNNPLHLDSNFAARTRFKRPIAHGFSYAFVLSRIIGTHLPGPGALWLSQSFCFQKPVFLGDVLSIRVSVSAISQSVGTITLACSTRNQHGVEVMSGTGEVMMVEVLDNAEAEAPANKKQFALVVGGSRGIGAAVARRLDRDGCRVALTYNRSVSEAEIVVRDLDKAIAIQADASDKNGASIALNSVRAAFGRDPDIIVYCAASADIYGSPTGDDTSSFEHHFSMQVGGLHRLVSGCIENWKEHRRGIVVAIGTAALGSNTSPDMAAYLTAKAALTQYVQCLAVEHGHIGLRANIVAPGLIETALVATVPERTRKVLAQKIPLRRLGKPEDIANAVSYLVSGDSAYVTGQIISVNGG